MNWLKSWPMGFSEKPRRWAWPAQQVGQVRMVAGTTGGFSSPFFLCEPISQYFSKTAKAVLGTMSWQQALERTVSGLNYDLVDVERSAGGLLRVTIDRLPGQAYNTGPGEFVLVEDCEVVTRQLQYVLEVDAVDYARLEVSSPGLDRPLKKPADWQRFVDAEIELTLRQPFEGRKKWRGVLAAAAQPAADGSAWRLVLPSNRPTSRTALKRAAKAAAAGEVEQDTQEVLDFVLDEVREAHLVPVVDFKGRRGGVQEHGLMDDASGPEAETSDGGQD